MGKIPEQEFLWKHRVKNDPKRATHFSVAANNDRKGFCVLAEETDLLYSMIEEIRSSRKAVTYWEIVPRRSGDQDVHPLFIDVCSIASPTLLVALVKHMQERMLEWFPDADDRTLAVLKTKNEDDYRFIWPGGVMSHEQCLCVFDCMMASTVDMEYDYKFDRTYLDNGWVRLLWSEEYSHKGTALERAWIPHQFWDDQGRQLDRETQLPEWMGTERDWCRCFSISRPLRRHSRMIAVAESAIASSLTSCSYRAAIDYPTKIPWTYRLDNTAWDMKDPSHFSWDELSRLATTTWGRYSNERKIGEVVRYMNRHFAVITFQGAMEVICRTWDERKQQVQLSYCTPEDFVKKFENKRIQLHPWKSASPVKCPSRKRKRSHHHHKKRKSKRPVTKRRIESSDGESALLALSDSDINALGEACTSDSSSAEDDSASEGGDERDDIIPEEIMLNVISTKKRKGGSKTRWESIGKIWRYHAERKEYNRVVFNPHPKDHIFGSQPEDLNRWSGLRYSYKECLLALRNAEYARRAQFIMSHVRDILCDEKAKTYSYLRRWLACKVVTPWNKIQTLVSFYGKEGCGKGIFLSRYTDVFGNHGYICHDMMDILGKFNSILEDKVLCWIDEAVSPKSGKEVAKLKVSITEEETRSEAKYKNVRSIYSFVSFMSASTLMITLPVGPNNRRFCCVEVSSKYSQDPKASKSYFRELLSAMDDDDRAGFKAWVALLHHVELKGFDKGQDVPSTALLRLPRHENMDAIAKWLHSRLERGYHRTLDTLGDNASLDAFSNKEGRTRDPVTGRMDPWVREISKNDLFSDYKNSEFNKSACNQTTFWARVKEILPSCVLRIGKRAIYHKLVVTDDDGQRAPSRRNIAYAILPSLLQARQEFLTTTGLSATDEYPDEECANSGDCGSPPHPPSDKDVHTTREDTRVDDSAKGKEKDTAKVKPKSKAKDKSVTTTTVTSKSKSKDARSPEKVHDSESSSSSSDSADSDSSTSPSPVASPKGLASVPVVDDPPTDTSRDIANQDVATATTAQIPSNDCADMEVVEQGTLEIYGQDDLAEAMRGLQQTDWDSISSLASESEDAMHLEYAAPTDLSEYGTNYDCTSAIQKVHAAIEICISCRQPYDPKESENEMLDICKLCSEWNLIG